MFLNDQKKKKKNDEVKLKIMQKPSMIFLSEP